MVVVFCSRDYMSIALQYPKRKDNLQEAGNKSKMKQAEYFLNKSYSACYQKVKCLLK